MPNLRDIRAEKTDAVSKKENKNVRLEGQDDYVLPLGIHLHCESDFSHSHGRGCVKSLIQPKNKFFMYLSRIPDRSQPAFYIDTN